MKPFRIAVVMLVAVASISAFAQSSSGKDVTLDISPRLWGADIGIGTSRWSILPSLDTTLWVVAGGAWDDKGYFRNPDGSAYTGSILDPAASPYYHRLALNWKMGVEQGIIDNPNLPQDLLSGFLYVQTGFSRPLDTSSVTQLLFYPDTTGSTPVHGEAGDDAHVSLLLGLRANTMSHDEVNNVYRGYLVEGSLEAAPGWLVDFLTANVDYWRVNLTAKYFLPIYVAAPKDGKNTFALYAGDRVEADYLWGGSGSIPLSVMQQFGGTDPVDGLGDAVRGLEKNRFDANLKLVNNLELRASFPSLFIPQLVPGAIVFLDTGYYNGLPGAPAGSVTQGWVASTGAGLSLHVAGVGDLAVYTEYLLVGKLVTGGAWTPFSLALGLQF